MILLDTSGLLAALDASQRQHAPCRAALEAAKGPLLLSPFVLAELDYLLMRHVGAHAQAVRTPDQIVPAIKTAIEATRGGRPALLEVITKEAPRFSRYWE